MRIKNILQYLEATAARLEEKTAFSCGNGQESLTFGQLLQASRSIGSALLRRGFGGARVAILMERSPHAVAAMLGVWYAGGVSVMLDAAQPISRMQTMLMQGGVSVMIADEVNLPKSVSLSQNALLLDTLLCETADEGLLDDVRQRQIDTDPLYMVFTSGSSGTPKGVLGCHRALIDYAEALLPTLGLREDDVMGCQSPLHFDAPFKEILATMVLGATTCLIPRRCFALPMTLLQYLKDNNITAIIWVASALSQLAALGATEACPPTHLRLIGFGSEVFPRMYYDRWRAALPDTEFYQLYGPTEATGMSCIWRADRLLGDGEKIPIGAPLDNTDAILIGDDGARIVPCRGSESAVGELYLRGTCLTLGYCAAPAQTKTAFVQNPLHDDYPETVYRTGDMAAYNAHGELVFFGRRDAQIKRMGHRVELGEIEECALHTDGVDDACCVYLPDHQAPVLYYQGNACERDVIHQLKQALPRYMLPTRVFCTDAIPRTENGKKNRVLLSTWARTQFADKKED